MKIKGKGIVRIEQITCRALLLISVIAFGLCLVMEYFFPLWMDEYYCEFMHLDFLKNIMLGISGSAIISFICTIFPYLKKRNDFINKVLSQIKSIFLCYLDINNDLVSVNSRDIVLKKDDENTYRFEIELYEAAQELLKKIDSFVIDYEGYDWSSRDINNLIDFLHGDVSTNIGVIKFVVLCLLPEKYSNNPLEISKDLKKDIILKRSEKEIYNLTLKKMNEILNVKKFKKYFMRFQLEENSLRDFDKALSSASQTIKNLQESKSRWKKMENDIICSSLRNKIDIIKTKHNKQYTKETHELNCIYFKLLKMINVDIDCSIDCDIYGKFHKALEEDRMSDAKKIIDDLKKLL